MQTIRIEIPNYIRHIVLAEKIRAQHWKDGTDFPIPCIKKEYLDKPDKWQSSECLKDGYSIRTKIVNTKQGKKIMRGLYIYDLDYGSVEFVINSKKVGKRRMMRINAQDIYAGLQNPFLRIKIMTQIKEAFLPYVQDLPVINIYPLSINFELEDLPENRRWDLDNRLWLYLKAFNDLLTTGKTGKVSKDKIPIKYFEPKIRDDDRLSISEINLKFIPANSPKLTILIAPAPIEPFVEFGLCLPSPTLKEVFSNNELW